MDLELKQGARVEVVVRRDAFEKAFKTKVEYRDKSIVNVTQFLPDVLRGKHSNFNDMTLQVTVNESLWTCQIEVLDSASDVVELKMLTPLKKTNRRSGFRVKVAERASLKPEEGEPLTCILKDLSPTGVGLLTRVKLDESKTYIIVTEEGLCNIKRQVKLVRHDVVNDSYFYGAKFTDEADICKLLLRLQREQIRKTR